MNWHVVDFHFFLQIAALHNKNTSCIRWDTVGVGRKMEMFILAPFDLEKAGALTAATKH